MKEITRQRGFVSSLLIQNIVMLDVLYASKVECSAFSSPERSPESVPIKNRRCYVTHQGPHLSQSKTAGNVCLRAAEKHKKDLIEFK